MNDRGDDVTDPFAVELERFACGEMSAGEEASFLAGCEIDPVRWRDAALACVEHRRLAVALGAPGREATAPPRKAPRGRRSLVPRLAPAAVAAVALVVCGAAVGYRAGLESGANRMAKPATARARPNAAPTAASHTAPVGGQIAERLASLLDPLVPESALKILREAGIDVREEPVYFMVDGRDGERWAVPEQRLELVVGHRPPGPARSH